MTKLHRIRTVRDFSELMGHRDTHPLVSVIDYASLPPVPLTMNDYGVYGIFCHDEAELRLGYGCGRYEYGESTLICVAPGQIGGAIDTGERVQLTGWSLIFHSDLLRGTALARQIRSYTFFNYASDEALSMTIEEHETFIGLMRLLQRELATPADRNQRRIIVAYVELILDLCQRFYDRTAADDRGRVRSEDNDTLRRFEAELKGYYDSGMQHTRGVPGIKYLAARLSMTPNYLGDVVKKITGNTAGSLIRRFVIDLAKDLLATDRTIGEVAYECGFDYPQHFTRMFRQATGQTPSGYRRTRRGA